MSIIDFLPTSDKVYFVDRVVKQSEWGRGHHVHHPIVYGISVTRQYHIYLEEDRFLVNLFTTDNSHKKHLRDSRLKRKNNLVGHEYLFRISKEDEQLFSYFIQAQSEGGIFKHKSNVDLGLE